MSNSAFTSRIVDPASMSEAEVAVWNSLSARNTPLASPFLSFSYALAVQRAGVNVVVCLIYQREELVGFFPFQFRNQNLRWLKSAEPVGAQMTDYFGLIAQPELKITPLHLLGLAGLNQITFSHLDESQLRHGLTGELPRPGLRIPCARINNFGNGGTDNPIHLFNKKHTDDLQRRARLLIKNCGPLRFSFDTTEDRSKHLEFLIQQKRAQYERTGVPDALASKWKINLLEQLLFTFTNECAGVLSVLHAGDKWVASHFGIKGNGVLQYWLPVYNPELSKYAPGKLLLDQICQATPVHAIHTIDRGEGVNQSKLEVSSEEHNYYRGIWHNNSAETLVVRAFQSLVWRLGKWS